MPQIETPDEGRHGGDEGLRVEHDRLPTRAHDHESQSDERQIPGGVGPRYSDTSRAASRAREAGSS